MRFTSADWSRAGKKYMPKDVMAVADAFSAMTTDRPYRKGMQSDKALQVLQDGRGTQWDPDCVDAFFSARAGENQFLEAA